MENIPRSLSTPGALYSTQAFDLFARCRGGSSTFGVPAGRRRTELVTAGQGTWGGLDYITAALTSDHKWLLAYIPMTKEGTGPSLLRCRHSPGGRGRDGSIRRPGITSRFATATNTRNRPADVHDPGRHGDGTDDWVLVLDSTGKPRCGSSRRRGGTTHSRYGDPSRRDVAR